MRNLKRLISMALVLCTLLSTVPSMAVAVGEVDTEDQLLTTVVYNFAVQNTDLVDTNGKGLGNSMLTYSAVKNAIDAYYADETLNWRFAANNFASFKTDTNTVNDASYFGGTSYPWKGLRTAVKTEENGSGAYPVGYWVALHIRVPVAGIYDVTLNYQTRNDGAKAGEVYFLPGAISDVETIDQSLSVDYLEKIVDFTSTARTPEDATASLGEMLLEQGEYTVVFKAVEEKAGSSCAYMFLNDLTINLQEQAEPLEEADYDFSQAAITEAIGGNYVNKYFSTLPDATLAESYANGTINWQPAASNKETFVGETYSKVSSYLGYGNGSNWSGLRLALNAKRVDDPTDDDYLTNYWFAFNIKSPGEGDYDVTLNYQTRSDANQNVKVYLLPGGMTDPAQIQTAMDSATSLTSGFDGRKDNTGATNNTNKLVDSTKNLGTLSFVDGEYTLVVYCASESGDYFFLNGLHMVAHRELPPEETTTAPEEATTVPGDTTAPEEPAVVLTPYTFAIGNTELTYNGGSSFAGRGLNESSIQTALHAYYEDGTLSWKYTGLNNYASFGTEDNRVVSIYYIGGTDNFKWRGVRMGVKVESDEGNTYPAGGWTALTLRSPGKGKYDLTLRYQGRADATEAGDIYLLKGTYTDVAAVEAAMNEDTLLKTVNCKTSNNNMIDLSADLGTVELDSGEYTIVFKATASVINAGGYFYIDELSIDPHQEKPTIQVDQLTYDFALQDTDLTYDAGKHFGGASITTTVATQAIRQYYDADTLRWAYADSNMSLLKTDTNKVNSLCWLGGGDGKFPWAGLRLGIEIVDGEEKTRPAGYWAAFTILSPGEGNYQVTLDYQTRNDGATAGDIYLLKGTYKNAKAIEAAMAKTSPLKTVNFKGATGKMEDDQVELGILAMEKGEYTLVFKATEGKETGSYIYINQLNMLHESKIPAPPAPPQLDTGIYDFALENTDLVHSVDKSFDAAGLTSAAVQSAINKYYKNGELNWKFHSAYIPEGATGSSAMFGGTVGEKTYAWQGLRIYSKGVTTPMWQAFTIQSPGTGTYYPAFNYMKNIAGASVGKIYLLPGDTQDVAKAIASGKAIAEVSYDNRTRGDAEAASKIFYDQPLQLTAGEEYILVFTVEEPGVKDTGKSAYMYLSQFILYSEKTLPDPGPNVVTYDFDLNDRANGIYTDSKILLSDVQKDIESRYANGKLSWKPEALAASLATEPRFVSAGGLTAYAEEDDWVAVRCKAPGNGVYTLTMNYGISSNGALGAVYLLPGDTEDIAAAMDHSNRLKKVAFYNDTGEAGLTDGLTVNLGTVDFTGCDEFILVFEAYSHSRYSNYAYMYVSQVIAKEGSYVEEEENSRQISPIIVATEPVKGYETLPYAAATEVNGQDYLFVPLENKKMAVYNLEDMVQVDTVRIPFTLCRGITVDNDGILWLVGQTPVLFRYDPVAEVGMTTRNFGGEIPRCFGGFSIAAADNGVLYFGSYERGHIVKYIPATDEFINLGNFNEDAYFSCGAIVRDGYLYIGVTGDSNGDGLRTTEMLKIDTATDTLVDRLDITAQMKQTENMVRGTGIGGNTLFVGGGEMTDFVAIDTDTMELKEYEGFKGKQILYCGSEEINGKIYFAVSGVGLCEYDIASDTVSQTGITSGTTLRCGENSAVTLNDPLYPGVSLVTISGEMIVICNPQSKQSNRINLANKEKDGAGININVLENGLPGSNEIYFGGFNNATGVVYNIATNKVIQPFETEGQVDALCYYDNKLYAGNYARGAIVQVNLDDPNRNVTLLSLNNDLYEQNRVHTLVAGDGMIFCGTMPRTDTYDGCLAMVNLETLENKVERNIVDGCSVTGLAYKDGLVFGTTSISGGTGTVGPRDDTVSAKIFIYDAFEQKKVAELDPRDFFPGLPEQVPFIDAIAVDPDYENNGRVWALVAETLFRFTFDRDTGKFDVTEVLSYSYNEFSNLNRKARAGQILFKDNNLYVSMWLKGGLHRVNLSDYSDHERLNCSAPTAFLIAEDGNIYFAGRNSNNLEMYPLDVTEADWQAAEAMDKMIKAIGTVSLDSEETIIATRTAYDALPAKQKALVQYYEILQIAETDLLEAKIDTIGEVTKESQSLIEGLFATYNALPVKEQKYVKNYETLKQARKALQAILDAEKAAEVQKLIDSIKELGEITLEDEQAIIAIRDAFDALTYTQKQLVDTTLLVDAEAKIKALRQVKIDRLIALIAQIGEVTLEDEATINEAMEIYNWMYLDERQQVDYTTLIAADSALQKLQKAAAAEVDALIEAIGDTVGYGSGDAIKAARAAYDALTPGSKQYVKLLYILEEAEELYNSMFPLWAIIVIVAVVVAGGAVAVVVILKKRKAKEAVPAAQEDTPAEPQV